jgi:hypothetical protein
MTHSADEVKLIRCLDQSINIVQEVIDRFKAEGELQPDGSLVDTALDVNVHSFTLNAAEETAMTNLKAELEPVFSDALPTLSKHCRRYLLDFLYQYDFNYETREFKTPFNIGMLEAFTYDLQSMVASLNAFQASWNGDLAKVQDFIKKCQTMKDKSGLWGTTLLYSAARNKRTKIVQYLVKTARCSVNAPNQQHIKRIIAHSSISDDDYQVNPTAGSTALHGACYDGNLEIVKFLIENGADCFLKTHVEETPIMNAEARPDILQYFRDILILGYSLNPTEFPTTPILEDNQPIKNGIHLQTSNHQNYNRPSKWSPINSSQLKFI